MSKYRKNHYLPKGILFNFTGKGKTDFYYLNEQSEYAKIVEKNIQSKNDFRNIGEINNLYELSNGDSLEQMMKQFEDTHFYPLLNRCQAFLLYRKPLLFDEKFLVDLSWYIWLMTWRNADRIGFYKQFENWKKIGIKVPDWNTADWMVASFVDEVSSGLHSAKLIYSFIKSTSCYVHIMNTDHFFYLLIW